MDTVTRTFPVDLTNNYTANAIIELCHFRDMTFDADERVGVYLEAFFCNLNLRSFARAVDVSYEGGESQGQKMAKLTAAETKSEKLGLRILGRKSNTGNWQKKAEIILVNRGRDDYFDLLQPYLAKNQVRVLEKNDALAIQLVDYGNGLLKSVDSLGIEVAFTVTIAKKNSLEAFEARLASLELAIKDRINNVPPNSLLGRNENTGVVEIISQSNFATPEMIDQAIIDWVGSAPGNLNTLIELGNAINNDANFAASVLNALAAKAPLVSPIFTGFSRLGGNTAIKVEGFTGTVNSTAGGYTVINHGLTGTIIGVLCTVQNDGNGLGAMTPGFNVANSNLEYYAYATSTQFVIYTKTTNSSSIVGKAFNATIIYR